MFSLNNKVEHQTRRRVQRQTHDLRTFLRSLQLCTGQCMSVKVKERTTRKEQRELRPETSHISGLIYDWKEFLCLQAVWRNLVINRIFGYILGKVLPLVMTPLSHPVTIPVTVDQKLYLVFPNKAWRKVLKGLKPFPCNFMTHRNKGKIYI